MLSDPEDGREPKTNLPKKMKLTPDIYGGAPILPGGGQPLSRLRPKGQEEVAQRRKTEPSFSQTHDEDGITSITNNPMPRDPIELARGRFCVGSGFGRSHFAEPVVPEGQGDGGNAAAEYCSGSGNHPQKESSGGDCNPTPPARGSASHSANPNEAQDDKRSREKAPEAIARHGSPAMPP